jgi:hypothetical protein
MGAIVAALVHERSSQTVLGSPIRVREVLIECES